MIRTRDFLLGIVALVFLIGSVGVATLLNAPSFFTKVFEPVSFSVVDTDETPVVSAPILNTREENIARLKQKISRGEGLSSAGPVVLTSVSEPEVEDGDSDIELISRTVKRCTVTANNADVISSWPTQGIFQKYAEGARVYFIKSNVVTTVGSSTKETVKETTLLQLVTLNLRNQSDTCIEGEVIGVTATGALLFNADAVGFRNASPTTLIGYALDGFPIYGGLDDDTELDSCGGLSVSGGYQYHLRESDDFVIGCYAGTPAKLIPSAL